MQTAERAFYGSAVIVLDELEIREPGCAEGFHEEATLIAMDSWREDLDVGDSGFRDNHEGVGELRISSRY